MAGAVPQVEKSDSLSKTSLASCRPDSMPDVTELDLKHEIGRHVAEARIHRGLTQEQLAERLDCSVDGIAKIERGIHFPRFRILVGLSRELDVPLRDLIDQEKLKDANGHRARLERQGRMLLHDLSDDFLAVAVEQLSALAKRDHGPNPKD